MADYQIQTLFETPSLRVEDYRSEGMDSSHEEMVTQYEISLTRRGSFLRHDSSGTTIASVNQVSFFQPHQSYHIKHPLPDGEQSTVFTISADALAGMLRVFDEAVDDRLDRLFPTGHAPIEPRHHLRHYHLLRAMGCHNGTLALEEQILLLLGDVMHDAYQFIEKPLPILKATTLRFYAELAHETKMILAQRFREKLRLTDVADAVNCSPYFLCRVFNQETGLSIHQYLQRVRLFHALEQLAEQPTQDLAALALSLGFASHSHFSTTFVREFGLSPSQFRSSSTSGDWRGMSKILKA